MGWGGGSVGKVLSVQAWGPEFRSSVSTEKPGRERGEPWGSMASGLATVVGSRRFSDRPCLKR